MSDEVSDEQKKSNDEFKATREHFKKTIDLLGKGYATRTEATDIGEAARKAIRDIGANKSIGR
jgi:hypothetical protein